MGGECAGGGEGVVDGDGVVFFKGGPAGCLGVAASYAPDIQIS